MRVGDLFELSSYPILGHLDNDAYRGNPAADYDQFDYGKGLLGYFTSFLLSQNKHFSFLRFNLDVNDLLGPLVGVAAFVYNMID